jgi:hypothetical protein
MLIRIRHNSGECDYVKPHVLDRLIEEQSIISFHRRDGVAVLGVHPVRCRQVDCSLRDDRRNNGFMQVRQTCAV